MRRLLEVSTASAVALTFATGCSGSLPGTPKRSFSKLPQASAPANPGCGRLAPPVLHQDEKFNNGHGPLFENVGGCVEFYNPDTWRTIGNIATGSKFVVICFDGPKPAAWRIENDTALIGNVRLDDATIKNSNAHNYGIIPDCPVAEVSHAPVPPPASPPPVGPGIRAQVAA